MIPSLIPASTLVPASVFTCPALSRNFTQYCPSLGISDPAPTRELITGPGQNIPQNDATTDSDIKYSHQPKSHARLTKQSFSRAQRFIRLGAEHCSNLQDTQTIKVTLPRVENIKYGSIKEICRDFDAIQPTNMRMNTTTPPFCAPLHLPLTTMLPTH